MRLRTLAIKRVVHIMTYVLNYLYLGRHPTLEELRRRPNAWQRRVFHRLRSLLVACGAGCQGFPLVPGRSGPELGAALYQLEVFLHRHGLLGDAYSGHPPALFKNDPDLLPADKHPELAPYKNLDASRLKLVGEGRWPMADYLDGPLWLPYLEPRFLLHGLDTSKCEAPNFAHESREENLRLCRVWDQRGLLKCFRRPLVPGHFSRCFNAFKNPQCDRQIGDRRIPNSRERSLDGPSAFLPPGFLLCNWRLEKYKEQVYASITDRRDYYHQALVSDERAQSNMLPFGFTSEELEGTSGLLDAVKDEKARPKRRLREVVGDGFGVSAVISDTADVWYPAFASLFQGDHLGVEFALQAHETLLVSHGLLLPEQRLWGHWIFPSGRRIEGLIIDDYFALGIEKTATPSINTFAARALAEARAVYESAALPGSLEKDVEASNLFKAAGAEVDSSTMAVSLGLTTVAAPLQKRLGLSTLSLRAARLSSTTSQLISRLAGNWTSVLMFRRCLMAVVSDMFALAAEAEKSGKNVVIHQPLTVREELIMLAALAPVISTNIAVDYCPFVFASDSSLGKGAVVRTSVQPEVAEAIWLGSDKKGAYSKLETFPQTLLSAAGEELFDDLKAVGEATERPGKPLLLYYDFVEFYGGSGRVSAEATKLGLVCAPPLDLDASSHYDLSQPRLLEWAFHMIETGRFRSFLTEPPCTTFSAAAYPALRSYAEPFGFDPSERRTKQGNLLACRSFLLLRHGWKHRRPCGKEQPRLSKMRWLAAWRQLKSLGFKEAVVASCQFGSQHRKEFVFLMFLIDVASFDTRCPGGHEHVKIQGQYTKASAVYTWDLARHIAVHFARALRAVAWRDEGADVEGHESIVVNDILLSRQFSPVKVWSWRRKSHINVLEARSALEIVEEAAIHFEGHRVNGLLDSRVAKGALAKGRSTARGLQRACRSSAALQLAADVHMGWNFAPTRLNVADDPTRDVDIRDPVDGTFHEAFSLRELQIMHLRALSKTSANWARLLILVFLSEHLVPAEASSGLSENFQSFHEEIRFCGDDVGKLLDCEFGFQHAAKWIFSCICFWIFLGFILLSIIFPIITLATRSLHFGLCFGLSSVLAPLRVLRKSRVLGLAVSLSLIASAPGRWTWVGPAGAYAMDPMTAADLRRAGYRNPSGIVPTRVARKSTLDARAKLLDDFGRWLYITHGVLLSSLLTAKPADPEEICKWLICYGQEMFLSGKAYGRFAETINAVSTSRPAIRKQLSPAWDLAFAWLADEPFQHHPALPLSILLSMLTIAILWGWPIEASVFAMTWSGILRIGETIQACRSDLVLPGDAAPGTSFALLRVRTPKTRGKAARHQAARIDPPDIVQLLEATFADFPPEKKLWPLSAATLRRRFSCLLREIGLPTSRLRDLRPFDLGSLRPGGATFLLLASEDMDLVRRRGRWITNKVCECYLQEVLYVTYTEKLPKEVRAKIQALSSAFPQALQKAVSFLRTGLPPQTWYAAFKAQDNVELGACGMSGEETCSWGQKHGRAADGHRQKQ
eukprot:s334_g3.t1